MSVFIGKGWKNVKVVTIEYNAGNCEQVLPFSEKGGGGWKDVEHVLCTWDSLVRSLGTKRGIAHRFYWE